MSKVPFKVKAIYEYSSPHDDDLSFPNSQIITVTAEEDDDWYAGEFVDVNGGKHQGIFPRNFVEKYEPEVPSRPVRPTRAKKESEHAMSAPVAPEAQNTLQESVTATQEDEPSLERPAEVVSPQPDSSASPTSAQPASHLLSSTTAVRASQQPQANSSNNIPPEAPDKPSGGSFKDRIAAFNKPAAPPIAPFKPGTQGSSGSGGFIKKPFVAAPPSKNSYVPPLREAPPAKPYTREEDPGLDETAEDSETSMPLPGEKAELYGEERSKPTSLKDRIALLQKQQLEQAARHAEAAQKKEKPKRPTKKRTESQEQIGTGEASPEADPDLVNTSNTIGKKSVDFADDESEPLGGQGGHQPSTAVPMSMPPPPSRELISDTNDADYSAADDTEEAYDTSTSREDDRERGYGAQAATRKKEPVTEGGMAEKSDGENEEERDIDPEVRRKMELRERMAKMSGGMGLMGMFGPPGGIPPPGKRNQPTTDVERDVSGSTAETSQRAPPIPVPGMSNVKNPERKISGEQDSSTDEPARDAPSRQQEVEAEHSDNEPTEISRPPPRASTDRAPPPVPQGRAVPPPPPRENKTITLDPLAERPVPKAPSSPSQGRGAPPPPPVARPSMPTSPGELSDDELSFRGSLMSPENTADERSRPQSRDVPSLSTAPPVPTTRPAKETSTPSPASPISASTKEKRVVRSPPTLPSSPTSPSQQFRAPPPPPPTIQPPSRKSTSGSRNLPSTATQGADSGEGEVTEYDGDYDTDIASSVKHKDALKSYARDSGMDGDSSVQQTASKRTASSPDRGPPPLPNVLAPRDIPPQPPSHQTGNHSRRSTDMPRAAPPPIPPPKEVPQQEDDEYDPYRYNAPYKEVSSPTSNTPFSPVNLSPEWSAADDDLYEASPRSARAPPPLPAQVPSPMMSTQASQFSQNVPRQSLDVSKPHTATRRSVETPRKSGEQGFMATDVDLAPSSQWYAQNPNVPPPSLQQRNDILLEIESSTSTKRGNKTTISKDIYVLYMDYSQTIINATFDTSDSVSATLEQRHEHPPPPPRQDQLEVASTQFGALVASSVSSKANTIVGDGSPYALIANLLQPLSTSVLMPIGNRAYGASVYSNLANASTQQFDEIRPGDIVSFRNAKFAGHKGLHAKYTMEAGKPDHVAVVADWDGTKKKIRVWEQKGKEGGKGAAKVKEESYRVADLKSGELRVWRLMGRGWVGWEGGQK